MLHPASTSRDPVCGMDVEIARSVHSTTYRGLVFYFCSSQCLERFDDNPVLYMGPQQNADIQPILKRRKLRLAAGNDEYIDAACRHIRKMMGVSSVSVEKDCLVVKYDLRQATLTQIETVASDEEVKFKNGVHGLRRGIWKLAERNELDNAAHAGTGVCCNHPPARGR